MLKRLLPFSLLFFFITACTTLQQSTTLNYKNYKIEKQASYDSSVVKMLAPYTDSINKTMYQVIGFSTKGLSKKQPESDIGNFMTDCMREMAQQKFGKKVDAAFVNYGGIRGYISKGDITVGNIFEVMPFDNLIVIQEVKGNVFKLFLNKVAEKGGWPVSGITMQIKDKKPVNILVNGKPIDDYTTYIIANSDYIALQGGDDCDMLKGLPTMNKGYIYRDAIIDYIKQITKQGKPIDWKVEGRVTY